MFYGIIWLSVIASTVIAFAITLLSGQPYFVAHIALFIPGGIATFIYMLFNKGNGFWGRNKFLTFIFATIPALISGFAPYLVFSGEMTL